MKRMMSVNLLEMFIMIREGNGNPLQYSFQENPMDRGVWWATVHEVAKSKDTTEWLTHAHILWPFKKENYDS